MNERCIPNYINYSLSSILYYFIILYFTILFSTILWLLTYDNHHEWYDFINSTMNNYLENLPNFEFTVLFKFLILFILYERLMLLINKSLLISKQ